MCMVLTLADRHRTCAYAQTAAAVASCQVPGALWSRADHCFLLDSLLLLCAARASSSAVKPWLCAGRAQEADARRELRDRARRLHAVRPGRVQRQAQRRQRRGQPRRLQRQLQVGTAQQPNSAARHMLGVVGTTSALRCMWGAATYACVSGHVYHFEICTPLEFPSCYLTGSMHGQASRPHACQHHAHVTPSHAAQTQW